MRTRSRKLTALFFLVILSAETLVPGAAYALTSGPSQPEMKQFEPAGTGDLVDLFTGDLKYNIPLGDIDGYPLNLAYQSGTGMEDEASWVGTGWSLNPGALTRSMRGLPDDFNGIDKVTKEYDRKPFKKVGGSVVLKPAVFGWEAGKASIKVGVYRDNYYGMGYELGLSLGHSIAKNTKTPLTANLGINTDSRNGVSVTPSLSLAWARDDEEDKPRMSLSGSFTYNTRAGLKQVALGGTFSVMTDNKNTYEVELSAVKYFGQSYTPSIGHNTRNNGSTYSFDMGPAAFGGYLGVGGAGYVYTEKILNRFTSAPAYGYLNYLKGRKNKDALLDFNREKDGVFIPSAPAIAIPVATQDFFMATNQMGSQQFRPFFSGNYIVFDRAHSNKTLNIQNGVSVGAGDGVLGGARIDYASGGSNTNKWTSNNNYQSEREDDFDREAKPSDEFVYFKKSGENTQAETEYLKRIRDEETQQVAINDAGNFFSKAKAFNEFKTREGRKPIESPIIKEEREKRSTVLSYLTAREASKYGLDKTINGEARVTGDRLAHHISEMTVTDGQGARMVYGIPVYNFTQQEVTFSAARPDLGAPYDQARRNGIITYELSDNKPKYKNGRDQMYSKETTPAYATSFLLTGILSPDYVDVKGDGISDDDLGTAIKLNYAKHTNNYQWRAPYGLWSANYNEGFASDAKDDKGSYVYGKKEIWYLDKIAGKTMVAVFETSPRQDGLGVIDEHGAKNSNLLLRQLDRIKIYSRADYAKGPSAVPVKTIHFEYDYSLFPEMPNNSGAAVEITDPQNPNGPKINLNAAKGKLTLKKVYFTFGSNERGKSNPYEFEYDMRLINSIPGLPVPTDLNDPNDAKEYADQYTGRQQDRWGTYKHSRYNRLVGQTMKMNNSEFPYTLQDNANTLLDERTLENRFASKWQLNKITTPTGSVISAEYESDDYAYVQNRKAMQMCFIQSVGSGQQSSGNLITSEGFKIELPVAVPLTGTYAEQVAAFSRMYLEGADGSLMKNIYYKVFTDLTNKGHYEYVQGYAEFDLTGCSFYDGGKTVYLKIKKVSNKNAVSKAAWQMMKADLPHYAYDSYDNSDATTILDNYIATIKSMVASWINLRELFLSFDEIASAKNFANNIEPAKSMVRLYSPSGKKMGGGCRVKQLMIMDNWQVMTDGISKNASYGQVYSYLTKDAADKEISSGVAAYEPSIGNEENPFHEPDSYTEKVHWSLDKYHHIEKPYCETYFPAPSVGYSKVTVTSVGDDFAQGGPLEKHTGYIENGFYTARDFPTRVDNMTLEQNDYESSLILKLFSCTYVKRVVASQGFKVELNDMHGKPKSVKVFDKRGDLLSATETFYNVMKEDAETAQLNNRVDLLCKDGTIKKDVLIGTDIDFVTDMRESKSENIGTSVGAYLGFTMGYFLPIPYGSFVVNANVTADSYHSTSSVKVIHKYGIPRKVRSIKNGSEITAENLLWDGETGQVVLTRTQNGFNDHTYAFTYPAHLAERNMGGAYKNIGAVFPDFYTGTNGGVPTGYYDYVNAGDELVSLDSDKKGWIIAEPTPQMTIYRLVDANGEFINTNGRYMVVRSGRRNLTDANVGAVVCMKDPRIKEGNAWKLQLDGDKKILDAKTVLYKEKWALPVSDLERLKQNVNILIPRYDMNATPAFRNSLSFNKVLFSQNAHDPQRRFIFSFQEDNVSLEELLNRGVQMGVFDANIFSTFFMPCGADFDVPPLSEIKYYLEVKRPDPSNPGKYRILDGDIAYIGTATKQIGYIQFNLSFDMNTLLTQVNGANPVNCNAPLTFSVCPTVRNETGGAFIQETFFMPGYNCQTPSGTPVLAITWRSVNFNTVKVPNVVECYPALNNVINPYKTGVLGNWRPDYSMVYTVIREQRAGLPYQNGGTNIRQSGYYSMFDPFWTFGAEGLQKRFQLDDPNATYDPFERWIWSAKPVYFDPKGNEIESMDALKRYSSALFGYRESVATAVAANARRNEIAFDGFEDYGFVLQNNLQENCPSLRHFDWGLVKLNNNWCAPGGCISTEQSHSGKYSFKLDGNVSITKEAGNAAPVIDFLGFDNNGRYKLLDNELAAGFRPINGKKYLLSIWVRDNAPTANKINGLTVSINGQNRNVNNIVVPVVEEWKRLELEFVAGSTFSLQLSGSNIYIDDMRILPFDGQLTSFVYDDVTMRLLAQMDENNFATFYEYDDEGTPIRVKKETERGIMTIKESRQFFRKKN